MDARRDDATHTHLVLGFVYASVKGANRGYFMLKCVLLKSVGRDLEKDARMQSGDPISLVNPR